MTIIMIILWVNLTTNSILNYFPKIYGTCCSQCNIPEVPPYQAVLAIPQALGPPVDGRRHTTVFMYHKHADTHTHTFDPQ